MRFRSHHSALSVLPLQDVAVCQIFNSIPKIPAFTLAIKAHFIATHPGNMFRKMERTGGQGVGIPWFDVHARAFLLIRDTEDTPVPYRILPTKRRRTLSGCEPPTVTWWFISNVCSTCEHAIEKEIILLGLFPMSPLTMAMSIAFFPIPTVCCANSASLPKAPLRKALAIPVWAGHLFIGDRKRSSHTRGGLQSGVGVGVGLGLGFRLPQALEQQKVIQKNCEWRGICRLFSASANRSHASCALGAIHAPSISVHSMTLSV